MIFAFNLKNGVTLCRPCHKKTDSYAGRPKTKAIISSGTVFARIISIPHRWQDYDTLGNWLLAETGEIAVFVSADDGKSPISDGQQMLTALHELVEVLLCRARGITQAMVDDFDIRGAGSEYCNETGIEPGDHPEAPYRREHRFAMIVEHLLAHEMGLVGYGEIK